MESEEKKVVETDNLSAAPNHADEVKMDVQRGSDTKDNYGTFSSDNPTISVAAQKPVSFNMDSRSVLTTKKISFS